MHATHVYRVCNTFVSLPRALFFFFFSNGPSIDNVLFFFFSIAVLYRDGGGISELNAYLLESTWNIPACLWIQPPPCYSSPEKISVYIFDLFHFTPSTKISLSLGPKSYRGFSCWKASPESIQLSASSSAVRPPSTKFKARKQFHLCLFFLLFLLPSTLNVITMADREWREGSWGRRVFLYAPFDIFN